MSGPDTSGSEIHSIPIDSGPAQFNAFYPQCSGRNVRLALSASGRSTADRILSIIGTYSVAPATPAVIPRLKRKIVLVNEHF